MIPLIVTLSSSSAQTAALNVRDSERLLVFVLATEVIRFLLNCHALQHDAVGRGKAQLAKGGQAVLTIQNRISSIWAMAHHQYAQLRRVKVPDDARHVFHVQHPLILLRHDARQGDQLNLLVDAALRNIVPGILRIRGCLCPLVQRFLCLGFHRVFLAQILRSAHRSRLPVCHDLFPHFHWSDFVF